MLKIRLRRMGAIRQPHYRIVVADARAPRDGHFLEILGHYNPRTEPATIQVDVAKYEEWKRKGAQPTDAVSRLVRQFNRATSKAEAAQASATSDGRTRTASGKRMSKGTTAAPAVAEAEETAQAEAAQAEAAEAEAEEFPGEEATDEPVLEAASATPEGAAEGESDTDTAS